MSFSARVLGIGAFLMAGVRFAGLPVGAEVLPQASTPSSRLGSGFSYRHDQVAKVPWSVQIARVSRSRTNFILQTTLAGQDSIGVATVSEQMSRWPRTAGRPMAAVNGDYFARSGTHEGDPEGLHISNGELISAPNGKSCFWVDAQGQPHVGEVKAQFNLKWPDGSTTPLGLNEDAGDLTAVLYTSAVEPASQPRGTLPLAVEAHTNSPSPAVRVGENLRVRLRPGPRSRNTNGLSLYLTRN